VRVVTFNPELLLMGSIRRPKRIKFNGNDEKEYPFLAKVSADDDDDDGGDDDGGDDDGDGWAITSEGDLVLTSRECVVFWCLVFGVWACVRVVGACAPLQGGEDLRLDQRIQTMFRLMNKLLRASPECQRRNLAIKTYHVVPVTQDTGLIQWVMNTEPVKSVLEDEWTSLMDPRLGFKINLGVGRAGNTKAAAYVLLALGWVLCFVGLVWFGVAGSCVGRLVTSHPCPCALLGVCVATSTMAAACTNAAGCGSLSHTHTSYRNKWLHSCKPNTNAHATLHAYAAGVADRQNASSMFEQCLRMVPPDLLKRRLVSMSTGADAFLTVRSQVSKSVWSHGRRRRC